METAVIDDYPNYSIGKDGSIMNNETGHVMTPYISKVGYYQVCLGNKRHYVHRLLAKAFIPNPDNKPFIDHINRISLDNRLENLRWATICENNQNQSLYINNKLKEQYICKHVRGYHFQRTINYKKIHKMFKTLQEAIDYRLLFTVSYPKNTSTSTVAESGSK